MVDFFGYNQMFSYFCIMKTVKIYKLVDPITQEIRYVGKTEKSLKHRLSMHISTSVKNKNKTHKEAWITQLHQIGKRPIIELIEEVPFDLWEEREKYWISQFNNLTNLCIGGIGGIGRIYSESERLEKSKLIKKLIEEGKIIYTEERNKKIAEAHKGKIVSESTKQKLRILNLGKKQGLEQKLKTAKAVIRECVKTGEKITFLSLTLASENTQGCTKGNISSACKGRLKTYKGFKWYYKKEDIVDSI